MIFRKAAAGELQENSALSIFANLADIDVTKEGVSGAKQFFEAKVSHSAKFKHMAFDSQTPVLTGVALIGEDLAWVLLQPAKKLHQLTLRVIALLTKDKRQASEGTQ